MPDGGLLVRLPRGAGALPDLPRELAEAEGGAYVAIAVGDTGSGMSEEVKERAFEPLLHHQEAGCGTGLGLATVYGFAKQSKGHAGQQRGQGHDDHAVPARRGAGRRHEAGARETGRTAAGLCVPLVEDAEVRSVAQRFLVCQVARCSLCARRAGALRAAARGGPDLLITDIARPGMRGTELAELARAHCRVCRKG